MTAKKPGWQDMRRRIPEPAPDWWPVSPAQVRRHYSAALASDDPRAYFGRQRRGYKQTLLLCGVHGMESEAVAGAAYFSLQVEIFCRR